MTCSFSCSSKAALSLVCGTQTLYCGLKAETEGSGNIPSHAAWERNTTIIQMSVFHPFWKRVPEFSSKASLGLVGAPGFLFQHTRVERCALCYLVSGDKKQTGLDSDWCWMSRVHHSWQGGSRPEPLQPSFTSRDFCTSPVLLQFPAKTGPRIPLASMEDPCKNCICLV